MKSPNQQSGGGNFTLNWRYIAEQGVDSFRTFLSPILSPVRSAREIQADLEIGRKATSEYVRTASETLRERGWMYILRRLWTLFINWIRGN